jgi:arylsulfatase A-like enzyme
LLKELGIDDRTIVFFCSDNGASMRNQGTLDSSGPLTGHKRSMHEGGIRVPLIVRWPGRIRAGQVSDLPTYFPDVMPTLAELAGVASHLPQGIDGVSLVPTLLGRPEAQKRHEYLYWEWPKYNWRSGQYTGMMQAVRHGRWKLLRHADDAPWELYDLSRDLGEEHDLADEHADLVAKLNAWVTANRVDPPPQKEPTAPKDKRFR